MTNQPYQQCTKTVMDNIADPNITFDENGVCNYWYDYQRKAKEMVFHGEVGAQLLAQKIEEIKTYGKSKKYDCLIGLSGGVDSTYVAYLTKKLGLRPLAIHFDNGWNSEIAVQNINNIIDNLGCDLHTLVVDWEEFKDLQLAYLKAGVIDIEVLTDHAIFGAINKLARKYDIKYVLSGSNVETEAVLPNAWVFNKRDSINIKAIHKLFGTIPVKTYPFLTVYQKRYYSKVLKLEYVKPINYQQYIKDDVKKIITTELGWKDYGGKHYESVFTKFYQAYILPTKFKVDKRKAHLSNLICSNQLTRDEALAELEKPLYPEKELEQDKDYVLKKFGLSATEFDQIMKKPPIPHTFYQYDKGLFENNVILRKIKHLLK
ncbi:MAG: N-acetyl sugar amidotransferase [Flavobacteriales bacterium]|nr:N-acetyl sugar amidotransferase [Flavobacteriales bacterium]